MHEPDQNYHNHQNSAGITRALWWALGLNAAFLAIEFAGGLLTNSLALLADAGHMLTDVAALVVALIAHHVSERAGNHHQTYGFGRVKVLAALLNGLTLWLIVGVIGWEALHRLVNPPQVKTLGMLIIAGAGLAANLLSAWFLKSHQHQDINIRGAFLHLMADSLGSVAVILAGAAMMLGGWYLVDPLASLVISIIILWNSFGIVRDAAHILLESTPRHIVLPDVKRLLESYSGVIRCHDLHIWLIGSNEPVLTAHLVVDPEMARDEFMTRVVSDLSAQFGISHVTLQVEAEDVHPDMGCIEP